jgi:hypothetical protein
MNGVASSWPTLSFLAVSGDRLVHVNASPCTFNGACTAMETRWLSAALLLVTLKSVEF